VVFISQREKRLNLSNKVLFCFFGFLVANPLMKIDKNISVSAESVYQIMDKSDTSDVSDFLLSDII